MNTKPKQKKAPWFIAKYGENQTTKKPKPIRRRSVTESKRMRAYLQQRSVWLLRTENQWCIVVKETTGAIVRATEVHHMRGRAGSLLCDERFWLPVSAEGHRIIHDSPESARARGWICKKGEWNKPVKP